MKYRRLTSFILMILMLLQVLTPFGVPVFGASEDVGGSLWTYTDNGDGTAEITHVDVVPADVIIPQTLGGLTVTKLADHLFDADIGNPFRTPEQMRFDSVTSVTIPEGVTTLGEWCFTGLPALASVTLPSTLVTIGDYCFSTCPQLNGVVLPSGIGTVGRAAFGACGSLTSFDIPVGLTTIPISMFGNCTGLTSVTLHEGLLSISDGAFSGCRELDNVILPTTVTSLGVQAFGYCSRLSSITIPAGVTIIPQTAFVEDEMLATVVTHNGITEIGESAFKRCPLVGFVFPTSVTTIGAGAFQNSSVEDVVIPEGVTAIPDYAFDSCNIGTITLPQTLQTIGTYAFRYTYIGEITFPASLVSIGPNAFERTDNLTKITMENDTTAIDANMFDPGYTTFRTAYMSGPVTGGIGVYYNDADRQFGTVEGLWEKEQPGRPSASNIVITANPGMTEMSSTYTFSAGNGVDDLSEFQWLDGDGSDSAVNELAGETSPTLTITPGMRGSFYRLRITPKTNAVPGPEVGRVVYSDAIFLSPFSGGDGSPADPYQITTPDEFQFIRNFPGANFIIMNDIDMNVAPYNQDPGFMRINTLAGELDGNGHVIRNLYMNITSASSGMIRGMTNSAHIHDIAFEGLDITSEENNVAGLVNNLDSGVIERVYMEGNVRGPTMVFGLVSFIEADGIVRDCYTALSIDSLGDVASGLVGGINDGKFENSYALGETFSSSNEAGALVMDAGTTSTVQSIFYRAEGALNDPGTFGTGLTDLELIDKTTFTGWDFTTVWDMAAGINNGRPELRWRMPTVQSQDPPVGLTSTAPTTPWGADGTLVNTTTEMEYRPINDVVWTDASADVTPGLQADDYMVRYKAKPLFSAGDVAIVTVPHPFNQGAEVLSSFIRAAIAGNIPPVVTPPSGGSSVVVSNISIKQPPNKIKFFVGNQLDLTGLVARLHKSDSSIEDVELSRFSLQGITTRKLQNAILTKEDTQVILACNGYRAFQPITVVDSTVMEITIKQPPDKITYTVGDALDLAGLIITVKMEDGTIEDIPYVEFKDRGIIVSKDSGTIMEYLKPTTDKITVVKEGRQADVAVTIELPDLPPALGGGGSGTPTTGGTGERETVADTSVAPVIARVPKPPTDEPTPPVEPTKLTQDTAPATEIVKKPVAAPVNETPAPAPISKQTLFGAEAGFVLLIPLFIVVLLLWFFIMFIRRNKKDEETINTVLAEEEEADIR